MTTNRFLGAILCLLMMCATTATWAQTRTITGKVMDDKGAPVANASVSVTNGRAGTTTDMNGSFRLVVGPAARALTISYIGYASQEVDITSNTDISVTLGSASSSLGDVVVVGYGTVRKKDLTGSVASVQAKDFNQGVIATPAELLQNKVPGLEVTVNSGSPGAANTVKIRGNKSVRASQNPLYVVDGVMLDGGLARPFVQGPFGGTESLDPLVYINPLDIAQIDVLKDASSSAIYGSRGANGVIAITTKKGSAGPIRLEGAVSSGFFAGYMKKYETLNADEFRAAVAKYGISSAVLGTANTDAQKDITSDRWQQNYNLAVSGGNENGRFRASFLASSQPGFVKNTGLNKYLGTFAGNYKFFDRRLTIDFNLIAGTLQQTGTGTSNDAGSTGNIVASALAWNPTKSYYTSPGVFDLAPSNAGNYNNPQAFLAAVHDKSTIDSYLGNISGAFKILDNLEYKFLYGINQQTGERAFNAEGFLQGFPGLSGQGFAAIGHQTIHTEDFVHTLTYNTNLTKDLRFDALAGYEYYTSQTYGYSTTASGFNLNLDQASRLPILYTDVMQNAKTQNPVGAYRSPLNELQSYFARVNFNLMDRYYLTGTFRADGSSKFGVNNKYGYFPSVAAKWAIINESFMKNNTLFSNLAVRASYGITGNQEFNTGASQEQFNLNSYNSISQVNVANPNLKWESTQTTDIGLDVSFFKGRLSLNADYYYSNTKDILFQTVAIQPAPSASYFINLPAHLINKGFELGVTGTIVDKPNVSWDINATYSYNENKIQDFLDVNTKLPLTIQTGTISGQGVSGTLGQVVTNGQPINEYYLKPFGGFDASGNQIIGGTPIYAGDPNPHSFLGFGTSVRVRNWYFSLGTGGAFGYLIYNNTATSVTNLSNIAIGGNVDKAAVASAEKPTSAVGASTRFLESGSYYKLRNVTVRYNFGNVGTYFKGVSAYVTASNLFVITKFTGFDPEVNIDKGSNNVPSRSIEYLPYPTPRTITFGVNFTL